MSVRFHFVIALLLAGVAQAQVVDRMVAVVNKHVILESELDQASRVEFLLQGKPIDQLAQTDRIAVLERLIDRSFLDQQIVDPAVLDPGPEDLAAKIKELREGLPGAGSDERGKASLAAYGLTEQDVEDQLASQFRILRFSDLGFRGLVQ